MEVTYNVFGTKSNFIIKLVLDSIPSLRTNLGVSFEFFCYQYFSTCNTSSKLCAQVYISKLTQVHKIVPVFVKREDQYFKKFDKFNKLKNSKTRLLLAGVKNSQHYDSHNFLICSVFQIPLSQVAPSG